MFGIGVEAYTVGSAEFALSYTAFNQEKCIPLMDNGHYHPTEVVSDKIPALCTPNTALKELQDTNQFTELMVLQKELRTLTDRDFTRALWQSATECPVVFPEGVGVCPWMVPGGADIVMATSELMKTYQAAIWTQHGLFASGPDFDITFGLAHTIEKSAEIYVKVLSMGGGIIRQTITDDDLRAIARDFGVTLNEKFLN